MSTETLRQRLAEPQEDERLEDIRLEVGESLIGRVEGYRRVKTKYGPTQIVKLYLTDTGERRQLWISHTVLRSRFNDLQPEIGETIGIRRLEDHVDPSYANYLVEVDRAGMGIKPIDFGIKDDSAASQTPAPDDDIPF
jgi:hypothetical protein